MKRSRKRDRAQSRDKRNTNHKEVKMQQHAERAFLANGSKPNDELDELDELFERLPQIQPPPSLIDQILTSVGRLPRPPLNKPGEAKIADEEDGMDSLVKRNDHLPPS
jgi:hypothetical protein